MVTTANMLEIVNFLSALHAKWAPQPLKNEHYQYSLCIMYSSKIGVSGGFKFSKAFCQ